MKSCEVIELFNEWQGANPNAREDCFRQFVDWVRATKGAETATSVEERCQRAL